MDAEDEDLETEKNELIRLMKTAGDENKRAIIRESLNILESPRKKLPGQKRMGPQGLLMQQANVFETEKMHGVFTKSSPIRPMSAKLRRASTSSIPDTESLKPTSLGKHFPSTANLPTAEVEIDSFPAATVAATPSRTLPKFPSNPSQNCLQYEDISDIIISGCDHSRMKDWNPFQFSTRSSPTRSWISTGMDPQYLIIILKHCWYISQVTVIAQGIEEVFISIEGSIVRLPLLQNEKSLFVFPGSPTPLPNQTQARSIFGDRILLSFEKSSADFFIVDRIHIEATQSHPSTSL